MASIAHQVQPAPLGCRAPDRWVLGKLLRSTLAAKGAAIRRPADPVTANVVGFYKWGCRVHR